MGNYVLGLDLGPTSVGWSAMLLDENNEPIGIAKIRDGDGFIPTIGSRIFEAGVDNLGQGQREESKNKPRRDKRSTRRRLRRARGRRLRVLSLLQAHGILPEAREELERVFQKDPYELRARGLSEKLEKEEIGRIVLHIAKRRGFKSNRKQTSKDKEEGKIKDAMKRLEGELDGKTLGQFWHEKRSVNCHAAIRNKLGEYHWTAKRDQYEKELELLWCKQKEYYDCVLKNELLQQLKQVLFRQIRFELSNRKKKKVIGMCTLLRGQLRCPLSDRKAQEFRIWQKVNDLKITLGMKDEGLDSEGRKKLYEALSQKPEMTFKQIRKAMGWPDDVKINLECQNIDTLKGNEIDYCLGKDKLFGKKVWQKLGEEVKEKVWETIQKEYLSEKSVMTAEDLAALLHRQFGLKVQDISTLENIREPEGYVRFSRKALEKILPFMREGKNLYEAIQAAGFAKGWRSLKLLPPLEQLKDFDCRNPVVITVLHQVRKVVNLLVKELGKPRKIIIETARELRGNAEKRTEIQKNQKENQKERQASLKAIREYHHFGEDANISGGDVQKYRLWERQDHYCPYCIQKIGLHQLFDEQSEVDHILPYSMSMDNTMGNLVVCHTACNRDKGQRTPIDWLGGKTERWEQIEQAIGSELFGKDKGKWDRFFVQGADIAEKYTPERLLRDTSYITTAVRSYVQRLYPHDKAEQIVTTTKGAITAELRKLWILDPMLREGEEGPKNRDDLRHHAVDAAVAAVTSVGMIQRITRVMQDCWPKRPGREATIPQPWKGFDIQLAETIRGVKVSHRVQRKAKGQLHQETYYAKEVNGPNAGKFITRKSLVGITEGQIEDICDPEIKRIVKERLAQYDGDTKKAFSESLYLKQDGVMIPIQKVRVGITSSTMIEIRPGVWAEPGNNHHMEIFRTKIKNKEAWIRRIYSLWEVAQDLRGGKNDGQIKRIIKRTNPYPEKFKDEDVEFVMSLSKGESVILKRKDGNEVLARIGKISYGREDPTAIYITFLEHQLANVKGNVTNKVPNAYLIGSMLTLQEMIQRKVTVDPLGRVRRAND